jgi:2-alkyl-3-oxoalkanoate reductase
VREWLPNLAHVLGAPRPFRIPLFLARLLLPAHMIAMMTEQRGCSNARIKSRLDWKPRHASWREGFRNGLG